MNRAEKVLGYTYQRLPKEAKEKVLNRWRDSQCDYEWWDFVYEDAKRMGALMGIKVNDILFTGFWSQGDGACFTGRYACQPDAVEAVTRECGGQDKELIRIATELTRLQVELKLRWGATFECAIRTEGLHSHSGALYLRDWGTEELTGNMEAADMVAPYETFTQLLRDFADWIYAQLEAEHEHLTSDEAVIESIENSGLRFDAEGATI